MKTELFYFSGTGNSLTLAKDIANQIKDSKISSIIKCLDTGKTKTDAEIIGIITPVHFMAPPNLVKEFCRKLKTKKDAYIFSVANCGLMDGNTNAIIAKKLQKNLSASYTVYMPDNSIAFPTPLHEHNKMLKKAKEDVKQIATEVMECKSNNTKWFNPIMSVFANITRAYVRHNVNKQKANDKCTKCKICFNTCPVRNIKFKNEKITFGNKCQLCFACIQVCPQRAIEFGALKITDKTYFFNQETSYDDIAKQRA